MSASLAGRAGLVAALRLGADLRSIDAFRLREIVEFAFANIVLCVSIVPLAQLLPGGTPAAVRVGAVIAIDYIVASSLLLARRKRRASIHITRGWTLTASAVLVLALFAAIASAVTASMLVFQLLVVILLVRPMAAFLLVLASFEAGSGADSQRRARRERSRRSRMRPRSWRPTRSSGPGLMHPRGYNTFPCFLRLARTGRARPRHRRPRTTLSTASGATVRG